MSDVVTEAPPPAKSSKLPLIIGLVLALLLGGGGFFAIYSGMILAPHPTEAPGATPEVELPPLPAVSFVPVPQIIISLGSGAAIRHLRFSAQLEVTEGQQGDVEKLMPRVLDVLNGYLRAVSITDLEDPSALLRLRAQMLRRVQVVTGDGRVRDLLIAEFVLN